MERVRPSSVGNEFGNRSSWVDVVNWRKKLSAHQECVGLQGSMTRDLLARVALRLSQHRQLVGHSACDAASTMSGIKLI